MQAKTNRRPRPAPAAQISAERMRKGLDDLILAAADFVPPAKVTDTMRGWLTRAEPTAVTEAQLFADALLTATDLALSTPSASGQTAFDRMARQRGGLAGDEAAALQAMRQSAFRLMRVLEGGEDEARLRDLSTGEALRAPHAGIGADLAGLALAARLAPVGDGRYLFVSCVTPLDETGLAAASGFIRPGGRGLSNPQRCAEAVYRHVLRHGTPRVPGLSDPLDLYGGLPAPACRPPCAGPATNSFGIGLARGIVAKLRTLRQAREGALRGASGRDLVVAKADVVEAELAKLGLRLRARSRPGGRRVLQDVYDQGHEAGLGFECAPGIGHQR